MNKSLLVLTALYALTFKALLFLWAVIFIVSMSVPALTVKDAFDGEFTLHHVRNFIGLATTPLALAFIIGSILFFLAGLSLAPIVQKRLDEEI